MNRLATSKIGFVVVIAIILITMTALSPLSKPRPPVGVLISLDPTIIRENETSKLTLSVENSDLKTHIITSFFDTSPRISIYAGNEQRLHDNTYSFTIEASDPSEERVFTVTGSLDEKVSSSDYPIALHVYVDGNALSKAWDDVVLTIRKF